MREQLVRALHSFLRVLNLFYIFLKTTTTTVCGRNFRFYYKLKHSFSTYPILEKEVIEKRVLVDNKNIKLTFSHLGSVFSVDLIIRIEGRLYSGLGLVLLAW